MNELELLTMERQLELHSALAVTALDRWGMAGAQLDLLKHRENTVFKVTEQGERYAMRVHRGGYRSDAQLLSELEWLDSLRAAGVETTETVHCLDGSLFARVTTVDIPDGRQCDLLTWVPGRPIGSVEEGVQLDSPRLANAYQRVGEQAARIHNHGEAWKKPEGFTRFAWDEDGYFGETGSRVGRYWDLEFLAQDQLELLHKAKAVTVDALARFGKSPDRYGLIHGDMLPENLFLEEDEVRLIDWDDTGFGWHLDDFATAMMAHLGRPTYDVAFAAMTEGYRRHRSLPDDHLALLPFFLMARTLSYIGWAASRGQASREEAGTLVSDACHMAAELVQ